MKTQITRKIWLIQKIEELLIKNIFRFVSTMQNSLFESAWKNKWKEKGKKMNKSVQISSNHRTNGGELSHFRNLQQPQSFRYVDCWWIFVCFVLLFILLRFLSVCVYVLIFYFKLQAHILLIFWGVNEFFEISKI